MTTPYIAVLYEDKRGPTRSFGLHKFVLAALYDKLDGNYYDIENALDPRPQNGVNKMLPSISLVARRMRVVAVVDEDKIREILEIPNDATEDKVISVLSQRFGNVSYILLKKNIESVLKAAKECGYQGESLSGALDKKRGDRDIVFAKLSTRESRLFRDCILGKMESLQQLVSTIADLLQSAAITPLPDSDV